ncbi:MAG: hypothetical protein OXH75_21415 [Acidobacteria bacterium]|nr:hypothetical protein [Acidobacteriota bacterium]
MTVERFGSGRRLCHLVAALAVLGAVSACGGGGGSSLPSTATAPEDGGATEAPNTGYGAIPWQEDEVHATNIPPPDEEGTHQPFPTGVKYWLYQGVDNFDDRAPVMAFGSTLHVGADVSPPGALDRTGSRAGVALSEGAARDGVRAADVLAYLRTIASGNLEDGLTGLQKWNSPPYVRIVGTETDGRYIRLTRDAARIVNAALPFTRRLRLQVIDIPVTADSGEADYFDRISGNRNIFVRVVPKSDPWWSGAGGDELGRTRVLKHVYYSDQRQRREVASGALRADILIDPEAVASFSDAEITHLIVHELLHAAGFMSHTDAERFSSTLNDVYVRGTEPRSLIHPIDRAGLLAAYARFEAGELPELMTFESLGPWSDVSFHVRGDLALPSGAVAFGVAFRNGLPQPWAYGPTPASVLADNAALSGTASWKGALLGMTPAGVAVSGDASLTVELSKVRTPAYRTEPDGTLWFSGIQREDGSSWGDGDLAYSIEVDGNGFRRAGSSFVRYGFRDGKPPEDRASGEDFGVVTGAFFGRGHEGMGGVLERHDLSAAFGGKR